MIDLYTWTTPNGRKASILLEELAKLPVQYMDGRHDNWFQPPKVTSYL